MFQQSTNTFNPRGTWGCAIEQMHCPNADSLYLFDQSGYDLCPLEQEFAKVNMGETDYIRYRNAIAKTWFESNIVSGAHINHAKLFERKGYHGYALEQLGHWAEGNHLIHKMTQIKPKWGIDISIDYVDSSRYNTMELFHYEWDSFNLAEVEERKTVLEDIIIQTDFMDFAKNKLAKKDEWAHLDFVGQSDWTTKYLGLPEERFKLVPWNT
mgnify:CR=1 FL=1|jgi:hypothetical protein|tara:strand:- start:1237 stop:1869 length:633 start_codon:yes stop_codon:yes gene_type:complete